MRPSFWIGWDPREADAYAVCRRSLQRNLPGPYPVHGLILDDLIERGLYTRPFEFRESAVDGPIMWDIVSDAPQSTQHANARFLVPHLAKEGWVVFTDGDVLFRRNVITALSSLDPAYAVYCVKHKYDPASAVKMDGRVQTRYARKNWSSFMVFNVEHPANAALTPDLVNSLPGRDLHRFCWLDDSEIGELGPEMNYLVGESDPAIDPTVVHFTNGTPSMRGYEDCAFADEWRAELRRWAA